MSFRVKAVGFGQLETNLRKIIIATNSDHAGIGEALQRAVDETIIPVARSNAYSNFDTEGQLPDSIESVKVNQWQVDIRVNVPHGAVHEFGGTFEITDKQRAYFWARFMETEDEMWRALALSDTYTIPARPYLMPAIDQEMNNALEMTADNLYFYWRSAVGSIPEPRVTTKSVGRINIQRGFC